MNEQPRKCANCGRPLARHRYKNAWESLRQFSQRKYCGLTCSAIGREERSQRSQRSPRTLEIRESE